MPVTLVYQKRPDKIVGRLRSRAARNHRSLQVELVAIIEAAAVEDAGVSPAELLASVRRRGLATPVEAAGIVRAARDAR